MKNYSGFILCAILGVAPVLFRSARAPLHKALSAPTYYLALEARTCESDLIQFDGASNLPPGAIVTLAVNDFNGDAWRGFSDEVFVAVTDGGFFDGRIRPRGGMAFHNNLILVADFTTYRPDQPPAVLRVVGKKGEYLGNSENAPFGELVGVSRNPQLFQASGWYYGLEAIARVPWCGE